MKAAVKRLVSMIPVLIGVMLLTFIMLRVVPGDPVSIMLGEHYSQAKIDRLTRAMNLDKPMWEQFVSYMLGAFRGDLGISYMMNKPVTDLIAEAFPQTFRLALMAAAIAWAVGLIAGITAAVKQNKLPDHLFMGFSLAGVSVPIFMSALFLQYFFSYRLKILPLTSDGSAASLILPAIALGWNSAGSVARMTRSSLIETLQADYIDTARAKGLVVTMMALQISSLMSGAVITESVFSVPGIGRLATQAIQNRDMPLLQGTILFTTILVILGNLAADLLYSVIDPRIGDE